MIIYEVNLEINNDITKEYIHWLKSHVEDIVSFKGFCSYVIYKIESDNTNTQQFTVQYTINNRENLQDYLDNHAGTMRAEAIQKFGHQFNASRRILQYYH